MAFRLLIQTLSFLPLGVLYALMHTLVYPLAYYVIRYRRKVVQRNLRIAFPEKSEQERRTIEKQFYHWFCDMIAEVIYGYRATDEQMRERVVFHGQDETAELMLQHHGGFYILGHLGCWEWVADVAKRFKPRDAFESYFVYLRLKNESADEMMKVLRRKRGGDVIEMHPLLKRMVALRHEAKTPVYCMLADQNPSPQNLRYFTDMFGVQIPFQNGTETLAKKFDYPVFYVYITMPSRGHYEVWLETLAADPQATEEGEIMRRYVRRLEENIRQQPHIWLWTHNRFKYAKHVE